MGNLTKIKFHGALGEHVGRDFDLQVNSIQEALRAVDTTNNRILSRYFIKPENFGKEYRILVNGKEIASQHKRIDSAEKAEQSEVVMNREMDTIDVIPYIAGSDGDVLDIVLIVVGVILVATGVFAAKGAFLISNSALVLAGLALVAAGVSNLLAKPPEFQDFKNNSRSGKRSFLFGGPENVIGEGNQVPFGYGRLIIGSQVIDTTLETSYVDADTNPRTT